LGLLIVVTEIAKNDIAAKVIDLFSSEMNLFQCPRNLEFSPNEVLCQDSDFTRFFVIFGGDEEIQVLVVSEKPSRDRTSSAGQETVAQAGINLLMLTSLC
jgi:uracil-DNA glycosylase